MDVESLETLNAVVDKLKVVGENWISQLTNGEDDAINRLQTVGYNWLTKVAMVLDGWKLMIGHPALKDPITIMLIKPKS
jgi:hypothetical protein